MEPTVLNICCTRNELPEAFKADVKKSYYDRSPYASILVLVNGKFLVHKHIPHTFVPCRTWDEAKGLRDILVKQYLAAERAFR